MSSAASSSKPPLPLDIIDLSKSSDEEDNSRPSLPCPSNMAFRRVRSRASTIIISSDEDSPLLVAPRRIPAMSTAKALKGKEVDRRRKSTTVATPMSKGDVAGGRSGMERQKTAAPLRPADAVRPKTPGPDAAAAPTSVARTSVARRPTGYDKIMDPQAQRLVKRLPSAFNPRRKPINPVPQAAASPAASSSGSQQRPKPPASPYTPTRRPEVEEAATIRVSNAPTVDPELARKPVRNAQAGPSTLSAQSKPKVLPAGLVSDKQTPRPGPGPNKRPPVIKATTPVPVAQTNLKRSHGGAFGSHGKKSRTPGDNPPIGRELQRMLKDSPAEVSEILRARDVPQSPWPRRAGQATNPVGDHDSPCGSKDRDTTTPTPSAPLEQARTRRLRPYSGHLSSNIQVDAGPTSTTAQHGHRTDQHRSREPSPLKQAIASSSNRSDAASPADRQPLQLLTKRVPRPQSTLKSASSASAAQILPASDENGPSRPKRARPAPGAYTVPGMDDEHFGLPVSLKKQSTSQISSNRATTTPASSSKKPRVVSADPQSSRASSSNTRLGTPPQNETRAAEIVKTPTPQVVPRTQESGSRSRLLSDRKDERAKATPRSLKTAREPATPASSRTRAAGSTLPTPGKSASRSVRKAELRRALSSSEEEEEVEETIKDHTPMPDRAQTPEDEDLMAQYGEFMSPMSSQKSIRPDELTTTPSRTGPDDSKTPRAAPLRLPTPLMPLPDNAVASTSTASRDITANVTVAITTPSQSKSELLSFSPLTPKTKAKEAANDRVARIMAEAEAQEKARREESDRRLRAELEAEEEVDELDSMAEISFDLTVETLAPGPREKESSAELESIGSRRSLRIRNNSNRSGTHSHPQQSAPKVEPARRQATKHDLFFLQQKKTLNQGYVNGDAERILRSLSKSASPDKPDRPYPTPDSDSDLPGLSGEEDEDHRANSESDDEDDGRMPDVNIDLLDQDGRFGGWLDVAREIEASRRNSARHTAASAVPEWDGFWSKPGTTPGTPPPSASTLAKFDEAALAKTVTAVLGQHGTSQAARLVIGLSKLGTTSRPDVPLRDTLFAAVTADDEEKRETLTAFVLRKAESAAVSSFSDSEALLGAFASVWQACGARAALLDGMNITTIPTITMPVEEAVDLTCQLLVVALEKRWLKEVDARKLLPIMLLLAVDPNTSSDLRISAEEVVSLLCPLCSPDEDTTPIIRSLLDRLDGLPSSIKVQVLHALGQQTPAARQIVRGLAGGWLLAGTGQDAPNVAECSKPTVLNLIHGGERLLAMVKQPEPKYDMIDDYVSFLYEAVSDVEGLVSQTSSDQGMTDDHHPIVDLKVLIAKIAHNLRPHGDDFTRLAVSKSKSRVSQLAIVLEMQYKPIFKRAKRDRLYGTLGAGLEAGTRGQARLSFGKA